MKLYHILLPVLLSAITLGAHGQEHTITDIETNIAIMEKINIGKRLALYPTPVTVVGAYVNGKVNWLVVSHVGIIGHDHILVSMSDRHYTNRGVLESKKLSVNIVDRDMLQGIIQKHYGICPSYLRLRFLPVYGCSLMLMNRGLSFTLQYI